MLYCIRFIIVNNINFKNNLVNKGNQQQDQQQWYCLLVYVYAIAETNDYEYIYWFQSVILSLI
jgi:hypothetical protein